MLEHWGHTLLVPSVELVPRARRCLLLQSLLSGPLTSVAAGGPRAVWSRPERLAADSQHSVSAVGPVQCCLCESEIP